nr:hybrid sensor histidine kinase/response regulator [uncultured bacterium]
MKNDGPSSPPDPALDVKGICAPEEAIGRLAGCRDLYADTVASFFREVGQIVNRIESELTTAGDTTAMRKAAHGLKGFAGMCGAVSVAEAAAALEQCKESSTGADRAALVTRLRGEIAVAEQTLRRYAEGT